MSGFWADHPSHTKGDGECRGTADHEKSIEKKGMETKNTADKDTARFKPLSDLNRQEEDR